VKVILTQDLPWGQKGEEIVVAKGFARNYLFASSKAVHATTATRKEYSEFAKARRHYGSRSWPTKLFGIFCATRE
jgi:ribosomal protein L9